MNAAHMINQCFRHQHPEAFDGHEVTAPPVPLELRYGRDRAPAPSRECINEESYAAGYYPIVD